MEEEQKMEMVDSGMILSTESPPIIQPISQPPIVSGRVCSSMSDEEMKQLLINKQTNPIYAKMQVSIFTCSKLILWQ